MTTTTTAKPKRQPKPRLHREWFRPINGTKCPNCKHGTTKAPVQVWSWGEYHNGSWRTVQHFCEACWPPIHARLLAHTGPCGCEIELVGYGWSALPDWLTLEVPVAPEPEPERDWITERWEAYRGPV